MTTRHRSLALAMTCAAAVTAQFIGGKATRDALFLTSLDFAALPTTCEARSIERLPMNNADFNPDEWRPRVPNKAFLHARPDDKFWAARKLMAFTTPMLAIGGACRSWETPSLMPSPHTSPHPGLR